MSTGSDAPEPTVAGNLVALLTGGAMGLLVGILVGLSTATVVGNVLAALAALVGAFLGVAAPAFERMSFALYSWRIIGFGIACAAAVVGGVYVRAHEVLQPAVKAQIRELQDAGFDLPTSLDLVAYRQFGVVPAGKTIQVSEVNKAALGSLFATESAVCNQIGRVRDRPVAERLAALSSGGEMFARYAQRISNADSGRQAQLLDGVQIILCGG